MHWINTTDRMPARADANENGDIIWGNSETGRKVFASWDAETTPAERVFWMPVNFLPPVPLVFTNKEQ